MVKWRELYVWIELNWDGGYWISMEGIGVKGKKLAITKHFLVMTDTWESICWNFIVNSDLNWHWTVVFKNVLSRETVRMKSSCWEIKDNLKKTAVFIIIISGVVLLPQCIESYRVLTQKCCNAFMHLHINEVEPYQLIDKISEAQSICPRSIYWIAASNVHCIFQKMAKISAVHKKQNTINSE